MPVQTLAHSAVPRKSDAAEALRLLMRIDPQKDLENYEKCIEAFVIFAVDEAWERSKIERYTPRGYEIRWGAPESEGDHAP